MCVASASFLIVLRLCICCDREIFILSRLLSLSHLQGPLYIREVWGVVLYEKSAIDALNFQHRQFFTIQRGAQEGVGSHGDGVRLDNYTNKLKQEL